MGHVDHSLFFDYIGFEREKEEEGQIVLSITVKDHLLGDGQFIAGGVFATMMDMALGSAVTDTARCPAATIHLNVSYFDLTRRKSFTCKANLTNKKENLAFAEGEIVDDEGRLVVKGQGTFKLLKK